MAQLEGFATLRNPPVQIANLTVTTTAQSVIFGNGPATRNGTTSNGSPTITAVANTQGLSPGMYVSGTGVPSGSVIVSIVTNTSITISQNCTAAGTVALTFTSTGIGASIARIRISNLSATATAAVTFSDISVTSAPAVQSVTATSTTTIPAYTLSTMVASGSSSINAGDGIRIQPGATLELNLSLDTRIWVIASAAATPIQVACILQNG